MNSESDDVPNNNVMSEIGQCSNNIQSAPPTTTAKRTKKRITNSSSSSSSSSSKSSSSSSTSTSVPRGKHKSKRRRHNKKRGGKRNRRRDYRLDKLTQEINELRKQVSFCDNGDHVSIDDNISGELYDIDDGPTKIVHENDSSCNVSTQPNVIFDIETKLKEPTVPKTPPELLNILNSIQHFNSNEWSEVRYTEVQKSYNHTPGFVDLEINDELKAYDTLKHLAYSDKSYAAITYCVLKQREALQSALKSLLQWAQNSDQTFEGINEKVNELFLKGDLFKVSSDLLQLICGHRAEVIQMRRDGIINSVRDPIHKAALRKIPPSSDHIFKSELLTSVLEKGGGVRKIFFPMNKQRTAVSASQASASVNNSRPTRLPSQGQVVRYVPPQGTSHGCCAPSHISHAHQPSQGCSHTRPSQGQGTHSNESRPTFTGNTRSSFRPRGGRPSNRGKYQDRNTRKRAGSPSDYNNFNKKRKY